MKNKSLLLNFLIFFVCVGNVFPSAIDINDSPMETKVQSAPPLIMFLIDDSGSMDWEMMTPESEGKFGGDEYVFPETDPNYSGDTLSGTERLEWKSQWSGYNKVFYNPHFNYRPWPGKSDASTTAPRGNPHGDVQTQTLTLNDEYASVLSGTSGEIIVDNTATNTDEFYFDNEGHWDESSGSDDEYGADAQYTSTTDAWGEWKFTIEEPGSYDIYAWWDIYSTRDHGALYTVNHDAGSNNYCLDQGQNGNQWNHLLGTHDFSAGEYTIRVTRDRNSIICSADHGSYTLADAIRLLPAGTVATSTTISIKNSHYYTTDTNGDIYLVNIDPINETREYYYFDDQNENERVDNGELSLIDADDVPNAIKKAKYDEEGNVTGYYTAAEDLQNFANWYSYYRRRELTVKAAVSHAIREMEGVKVGLYTINNQISQEVLPIKLDMAAVEEIVIADNQDAGYSESGGWSESGSPNEYESSARYTSSSGNSATWSLNVPATDEYNVYAWWNCYNNRDQNAKYTINHAGGSAIVYVNQREESGNVCGEWVLIGGPYDFDEGTGHSITVARHSGSTGSSTLADAVKLESTSVNYANIDETDTLLDQLYSMQSDNSTPLRLALQDVGQYFDQDDGNDGHIGNSPFSAEADGGGCQKAYAIAMTDGFWNGSSPSVGNVDDDNTSFSGFAPYTDGYSDTFADVAMKYYYEDIANGLSNIVPTDSCDGATHQHMSTYTVSFGVTGTLDPNDLDNDSSTDGPYYENDPCFLNQNTPKPVWPNPGSGDQQKIDDLWHAAVNGRGLYFNAQDPDQLVNALTQIVSDIGRPTSGASVSVNSNELKEGLAVYQTRYIANEWSGDVIAFPVDPYSGAILNDEDDILWHAANEVPVASNRKIVTYDGSSGISFDYSSLSSLQKDALLFSGETDTNLAEARLNYVRGYTTGVETNGFRYRGSLLGDVVHSAPTLSPSGETIYVGANDGMLHAFDSETGEELFAYVPNIVFDNLKYLTKTDYAHRFFVDLTPTVKSTGYKQTILVGGLGKGGKGIYLLNLYEEDDNGNVLVDVENTTLTESYLATNVVKWEYSAASAADDDMGYTYSKPAVVRSNDPDHEWVVIIGNGYNSVNESAMLYIFGLDGTLLKKLDTGAIGSNGLSEPSVIDADGDFLADYAYAGDLNGNLWKFDLKSNDKDDWDVAYKDGSDNPEPLFTAIGQSITSRPDVMYHCEQHGFMVVFGTGKFTGETDRADLTTQTIYGIWDYGDDTDDSEYLGRILTRGTSAATLTKDGSAATGLKLLRQTVIDARYIDSHLYRTLSNNKPVNTDDPPVGWPVVDDADSSEKSNPELYAGWFFDLRTEEDSNDDDDDDAYTGERVIKDVLISDGRAFIVSFVPNSSPCSGGGDSFLYIMDACTGGRLDIAQFELGNDDDNLIDLDGDPSTTDDLVAPTGKLYTGMLHEPTFISKEGGKDRIYISSTTGEILEEDIVAEPLGMIYWRLLTD